MMQHYSVEDWQLFAQGILDEGRQILMEDHLANCDDCREIFLSLIEEAAVIQAEAVLAADFTARVMQAVSGEKIPGSTKPAVRRKKLSAARKKSFFDFAMAAAITLVFVGSGYFQFLLERMPEVAAYSSEKTAAVDLDWPGKIAGQAASWLNHWETKQTGGHDVE